MVSMDINKGFVVENRRYILTSIEINFERKFSFLNFKILDNEKETPYISNVLLAGERLFNYYNNYSDLRDAYLELQKDLGVSVDLPESMDWELFEKTIC
jgi:hypothetical protein